MIAGLIARLKAFFLPVAAAAGAGVLPQPKDTPMSDTNTSTSTVALSSATAITQVVNTSTLVATLQSALAGLEKLTGPEITALEASAKTTLDLAVRAAGPIAAQVFNAGLEAIPFVKLFAAPIEFVADPVISSTVGSAAISLEAKVEGSVPLS